jgi:PAS domain S-box-containing protein
VTELVHKRRAGSEWPRAGSFSYLAREDRWEWSDEVARMHGYDPGTVTPTTELILSHKHPDDKPTVAELIEQVRVHGVPFSSRHRIIDTRGEIHVVVVVGDRMYGSGGEVVGTSGFYVDVTDEFDADVQHSLNEVVATISENRAVINQAIGILMLTHGISADHAFDVLAWRSKQTNVKVRTIAGQFVSAATASGLLPPSLRDDVDRLLLTAHAESVAG